MTAIKYFGFLPALLLAFSSGFIKRSEKITIFEDGRVMLETEIKGDPDDVYNGDAMPTADAGWRVEDDIQTDSEGKKELTRQATREIAAGQGLILVDTKYEFGLDGDGTIGVNDLLLLIANWG